LAAITDLKMMIHTAPIPVSPSLQLELVKPEEPIVEVENVTTVIEVKWF
jgi:hypothetical protein